MTTEELRATLQMLGLSHEWLAKHLKVNVRTIERWAAGAQPIPAFADEALSLLEGIAGDAVSEFIDTFTAWAGGDLAPVMTIEPEHEHGWPVKWQRAIAWRVRQHVPDLRIVPFGGDDDELEDPPCRG